MTSGFFGQFPLSVPGKVREAQKTVRSRIEISRTLGFVSSSAHGSCARNRRRRRGSGCSKAESRGLTSDFFGLLPPCVLGRVREAQKTERSRIEIVTPRSTPPPPGDTRQQAVPAEARHRYGRFSRRGLRVLRLVLASMTPRDMGPCSDQTLGPFRNSTPGGPKGLRPPPEAGRTTGGRISKRPQCLI